MQLGYRLELITSFVRPRVPESENMMEVWDRGDIPGAASQRTSFESAEVTDEVGDDDFHDFTWEVVGRIVHSARRVGGAIWSRQLILALPRFQTIIM